MNIQDQIDWIVKHNFDAIRGLSTLELGSFTGEYFTPKLVEYSSSVTCIELYSDAVTTLKKNFKNNITVVQEDFHDAVKTVGEFDAVVLYGVLYHSPSPLKLIEDIANYIKPKVILLETQHEMYTTSMADEIDNAPGMRQSKFKTCGISLIMGTDVFKKALANLGYIEKRRLQYVSDTPNYYKDGWIYSIFELIQ